MHSAIALMKYQLTSATSRQRNIRVSTYSPRGVVGWLLALMWPAIGVGFLLAMWSVDDIAHGSAGLISGYGALVLASLGMCLYVLHSFRVLGYSVLVPEIVEEHQGVRLVADKSFDPLLSFIIFWMSCAVAALGPLLIMISTEDEAEDLPVTHVALALPCVAALVCLFRSIHYAWLRHRRKQYPGDIELTPQGIQQRVADRVVEVSWEEITAWVGGRKSNVGEFTDLWDAISTKQIRRFRDREPKLYSAERPQKFGLLMTPVVDIDAMHAFVWTAWTDPAWARDLLSSPDRVGLLANMFSTPYRQDSSSLRLM